MTRLSALVTALAAFVMAVGAAGKVLSKRVGRALLRWSIAVAIVVVVGAAGLLGVRYLRHGEPASSTFHCTTTTTMPGTQICFSG